MRNRERWVADTLLELADTLAPTLDPVNYWLCVADRYAQLIPSSSIRLAVFGVHDALPVVVNTDERLGEPSIGEFLAEEGPGIDSCESRRPVVGVRLDEATARWERLAPAALSLGFHTVHAFPFSRHEEVLGAVTILTAETTGLPEADVWIASALADAATIGMLNHRAIAGLTTTSEQLQGALSSRVIIEQAKGLVSARLEIGTEDAFHLIRHYARNHNLRIGPICERLLSRRMTAADLAASLSEHATKANHRP
ncbi:ANTAR domain-containing protein [Amycolatopsis sp. lyj-108]|uniref:ANTAR domain-containing protein n=1 Tax=Amycolatopsis sp. lyj-108 TaxID=2789286 RepID=UPI0039790F17